MEIGTIVNDRFCILERAGEGGMGVVYRAEERGTGKTIAIKVMHTGGEADEARFVREAEVLSSLDYPAIVACLGHGSLPTGEPWMAMEWVEGENLASRLDRGPLAPQEALRMIRTIAGALDAAHAQGIVHRDIKPGNIILEKGESSRPRLIDFGVARRRDAQTFTEFGALIGTPAYMAPEQIRGASDADERADLYALGVILFECLTGRVPFASPNFIGVMTQALFEMPPRIRDINPSLSPALDSLVAALLEKDPQRRLGPARALIEALDSPDLDSPVANAPRVAPLGLTEEELRFVSIVYVSREVSRPVMASAETIVDRTEGQLIRAIERIVQPLHGRVEGLLDGTIIVAFPARTTATDQAALAARTALAIRDLDTGLPIALTTGRAAANIGSLYSDAAIRASTLSKYYTSDDAIPIDETTRGLLDARFSIEQRNGLSFLLAEDPFGEAGRLLCGRPAPFVGRERELTLIENLFDAAIHDPQASASIVIGEAGSGKSRLGRELMAMFSRVEPQTEIWVARGEAVRAGGAFGMLANAVQRAAGIREGEAREVRHQKLVSFVQERVPSATAPSIITFLGEIAEAHLTDDPDDDELRAARRDPVLMRDRIGFAFEDLIDSITEKRPLVLLLEDLHWGDMPTVKVVDMSYSRLQSRPYFILALGRPELLEVFPNLFAEWSPSTIRLSGLSQRACQNLVSRILGETVPSDVVASIVERSAGHPLFLEELVRTVAESSSTGTNALPETVLAMVQSRVGKLPPEARRILRAASVYGEVFWQNGVARLLGSTDTEADVENWLRVLRDREIIEAKRKSRFASQNEFRFRHALFREATYAMLTDTDKSTGHLLAGTFLEEIGETSASMLANHFDLAHEPGRAGPYHARAAREALWGSDFPAVLNHTNHIIERPTDRALLGEALALKADAMQWLGSYEQSGQLAELALEQLDAGTDLWFTALSTVAMVAVRRINLDKLREMCSILLKWGADNEWTDAFVEASIRTGLQAHIGAQYEVSVNLIAPLGKLRASAHLRNTRVQALLEVLGAAQSSVSREYDKTIRHSLEAARLFEQIGDLRTAAGQRLDATFSLVDLGQSPKAIELCRELTTAATRLSLPRLHSIATGMLGAALLAEGQKEEALVVLLEAKKLFDTLGDVRNGGSVRYKIGRCYRLFGDYAQAEKMLDEAESMLAELPRLLALTHAHKALLFVDMQRKEEALNQATKGMKILEQLGRIGTDEILVRYAFIESLLLGGLDEKAAAEIEIAKERALWMADRLTDESMKNSFLTKVDENRRVLAMSTHSFVATNERSD